ncbi:hypothetical protein L2E82_47402 [Cichorium intybus]|uniref:Uncharacterized protein n=1 Tax=Cichorium intybus TaxID=13427 RepID=A0ACB8YWL4_CICIN|nr:hypothetical protein L2E82_47402 [Cichorium intybus]
MGSLTYNASCACPAAPQTNEPWPPFRALRRLRGKGMSKRGWTLQGMYHLLDWVSSVMEVRRALSHLIGTLLEGRTLHQ